MRGSGARDQKRAGRSVSQRLREETWEAARRNWGRLLGFVVVYAACATGLVWLYVAWSRPGQAWFLAGLFVGFLPFLGQTFLIGTGISHRQFGAEAERWTAQELAKLDPRVWAVFHDVWLGGVNVDHVAIGPGRVYALETKWTSQVDRGADLKRWAGQARHRAMRLRSRLAEDGVHREVVPLLVVWGPRTTTELEQPREIHGLGVVAGVHSDAWLDRMRAAANGFEIDHPARRSVAAIINGDAGRTGHSDRAAKVG